MCITKEQVEKYEGLLKDMIIDLNENGYACAFYADGSMVVIDETQKPPRAIICNNHEFQPGCCDAMQATNYYYQKIAAIFAKEDSEEKPQTVRNVIASQNNRVEYSVLGSCKKHYHTVQMVNGRASNCIDQVGATCLHRVYHPAVPCSHMEVATTAEQDYRANTRVEQMLQQSSLSDAEKGAVRDAIACELVKCNEAYREVMRLPINEAHGTREYWKSVQKRDEKAKQAYTKQFHLSNEVIKQMLQPQEAIAA